MQWGMSQGMSHIVASLVHMLGQPLTTFTLCFCARQKGYWGCGKFLIINTGQKIHVMEKFAKLFSWQEFLRLRVLVYAIFMLFQKYIVHIKISVYLQRMYNNQ